MSTSVATGYGPVTKELLLEGFIGPEHGLEIHGQDQLVRPYGFTGESMLVPHAVLALDEKNRELVIPSTDLPGIDARQFGGVNEDNWETWYSFLNFKQFLGAEDQLRTIRPTGFGWGIHEGHRGLIDGQRAALPERPTFYLEGDQMGLSHLDDQGRLITVGQNVGRRAFSAWRIVNLVGNPMDIDFRRKHDVY